MPSLPRCLLIFISSRANQPGSNQVEITRLTRKHIAIRMFDDDPSNQLSSPSIQYSPTRPDLVAYAGVKQVLWTKWKHDIPVLNSPAATEVIVLRVPEVKSYQRVVRSRP